MSAKLPARFTNEDAARKHLEALQWPDGPVCPHCGVLERSSRIAGGRPGLLFCNACRKQYSVTVGTIFERSKIPLNTWLYATHLLCSSKKGISSHQLARMLGVTYKTAWFMAHRIREAMAPKAGSEPPLGGEGQIVEADETYIGKKDGPKGRKAPQAGGFGHKRTVLSLVERGGKIRSFKLGGSTGAEIAKTVRTNVDRASTLHTDGAQAYKFVFPKGQHESVDHNKTFVREGKTDKVHTNTLEGFFSVFKRGMVGTYQHCGEQHLQRYLAEFDFRANYRVKLGFDDATRGDIALKGISGKRLTYRRSHQT
ncbi:MAG: IS1595 family transposase [Alphaproteobacteria bacterium]|nr:IS1595 family transposase [Alphaproteobacteria bacterium]